MDKGKAKITHHRLLSLKNKAALVQGVREPTPLLSKRTEGFKSRNSKLAQKESALNPCESERRTN